MQSAGTAGGGAPVGDDVISGTSGEERMVTVSFATSEQREDSVNTVDVRASSSGSGSGLISQSLCCRICLGLSEEELLSPCRCVGTLAFVHRSCLEKWLSIAGRDYCELCGHKYRVLRVRCYNACTSLRVWVRHRSVRFHLLLDICLVLLSLVAVGLIIRTCLQYSRYAANRPLVFVFSGVGVLAYCLIIHTLLKMHLVDWWRWWNSCAHVRLLLD
ncbi:E3 ubiquitin-protein ligase MARCHF11-like [Bacillus rossius redtenbacheri]|uniref:E3 ubiquitin-protein ligase MARCHF11-like n=1 Tax=Bacillus rossius redtenbacheri TaxID=93214 RepID=UPI002FDE0B2C